jgi:FixJ family two-component response regulator
MPDREAIVFIVDDDASVREALVSLVRSAGLRVEAFASAREFLARPRDTAAACLLLDVKLPDLNGLELQRLMTEEKDRISIVFITGHGDIRTTVNAMQGGAVEFLTKPLVDVDVLDAIQKGIARHRAALDRQAETASLHARYARLTPREREVMEHVVAGSLNKQIAATLGTREVTVKVQRGQVMHKMQAASLADLVRMAVELGIGTRRDA